MMDNSREARSGLSVRARAESSQAVIGIIDVNGVGKPADDSAPGKDAVNF